MKVKVKKKPAPSLTKQALRSFRGKDFEDVPPAVIAYVLGMRYHEKPAVNENPAPFITQSLNGRRAENSKVCREDAVCAMESVCRGLKMIKHGPGIKDLRISEMIEFCKSLNR